MQSDREITAMLVFAIFSAVLGMFQFGFNTGVINAPQKVLEEFIANIYKKRTGAWISEELRDVIWSITVSVFAIGGMVGGIVAPSVANLCGRKTGLVLNNTVAVLGVTLMSSSQLSQSVECLILGRFFIGLNCGLNTALVPMYLSEIAPVNMRGALGTVSQLGVTVGLLSSQVLGLKEILGTKDHWPFLFGIAFIPAVLQLVMLPFCPESPRYLLLSCGRVSEARYALRRLRNTSDVEDDMEEMRAEERSQQEEIQRYGKLTSVRELFNHPWLRAPLIIGIMMQFSQQFSGINAIFYYSTDIFLSAEVPEDYAVYATMGVGATMVIMTLVSMPLMDRLGRRTLHLYGLGGMFLASIFLTISLLVKFLYDWMKYISVISILSYTLFFGIGPGSIPLMITAELFTQGTRPAAMSVSVLTNWFANFVVGLTFPLMKRVLQNYLFLPFTVLLAIFWIFTYKKLPETKNRTFEEIAALFRPLNVTGSSPTGFPDYGCNLANIGVPDMPTSETLATPGLDADGQKIDRFRFDGETIGSGQPINNSSEGYRGSQGNIQHHCLPHTSCTSIVQNLSTNDQQPLIVDMQHDHHLCKQQKHSQPFYSQQHYPHLYHQQHQQQYQPSQLSGQSHHKTSHHLHEHQQRARCCLETTSFMNSTIAQIPPLNKVMLSNNNNCTYCERQVSQQYAHYAAPHRHTIKPCRSLVSITNEDLRDSMDTDRGSARFHYEHSSSSLRSRRIRHCRNHMAGNHGDDDDDDDEDEGSGDGGDGCGGGKGGKGGRGVGGEGRASRSGGHLTDDLDVSPSLNWVT